MNSNIIDNSHIKLSILLPSYNYKNGLIRILERLEPFMDSDMEIIIGDNSDNDEIKKVATIWVRKYPNIIKYIFHSPSKPPIQNWNFLIEQSTGKYVWMIHHDEYPESSREVMKLLETIKSNPLIDIFLLSCQLAFSRGGFMRPHFNVNIRNWLLRISPLYLLRRNIIGPTGMLVVRRSLYPQFDSRLIWLVDVDLYARLFCGQAKWISCSNIAMISEQERAASLTKGLGTSISGINKLELEYLQKRMDSHSVWIGPYPGESIKMKLIRCLEALIWYTYRILTKSFAYITHRLRFKWKDSHASR